MRDRIGDLLYPRGGTGVSQNAWCLGSHEASPTAGSGYYHTARGIADRRSDVERCHESSPFGKGHYRAGPRVPHFANDVVKLP